MEPEAHAGAGQSPVVNEPLRLLLSPQERAFIEERIGRAKRQLVWSTALPAMYAVLLIAWLAASEAYHVSSNVIGLIFVLSFFIVFGVAFHLLLAGAIDWIMFSRYRRNHRAFLNRYNRT